MTKLLDLERLPEKDRQELLDIQSGRILPSLFLDVIAKRIFNADVHPDRLNDLLREISGGQLPTT